MGNLLHSQTQSKEIAETKLQAEGEIGKAVEGRNKRQAERGEHNHQPLQAAPG